MREVPLYWRKPRPRNVLGVTDFTFWVSDHKFRVSGFDFWFRVYGLHRRHRALARLQRAVVGVSVGRGHARSSGLGVTAEAGLWRKGSARALETHIDIVFE